jgi:hypothetical protein
VRKSTGECLVDMSRSLVILATAIGSKKEKAKLEELRRQYLVPIADRLIQDGQKMVRQGMMQFLGPFMASFYPYQSSTLKKLLPMNTESDGNNHIGIVAQFFPHASSMVSRLNSAQNSVATAPVPVQTNFESLLASRVHMPEAELIRQGLPHFIRTNRLSALSLGAVAQHRQTLDKSSNASADIEILVHTLLDYFAALAIVTTGDVNTDAEMRVYCAYSFPAVVLVLGQEHWDGALKTCFQTLINPNLATGAALTAGDANALEPPLPVKRCLASSIHTLAHVLGSEITKLDVLPVFQHFFLRDADESVRLNVIRNFPSLLRVLPSENRLEPLIVWSEIMSGEECLGARKQRSATNPVVLNWRQRDYLARSLPDLCMLLSPRQIRQHVWSNIVTSLLTDPVSIVREDAIWTVPMLIRAYTVENCDMWDDIENAKAFSKEATSEVVDWIRNNILRVSIPASGISPSSRGMSRERSSSNHHSQNSGSKPANFTDRQVYCRICAAVGLALRYSEEFESINQDDQVHGDPVSVLTSKFRTFFDDSKIGAKSKDKGKDVDTSSDQEGDDDDEKNEQHGTGPYERLTPKEAKHLKSTLVKGLLPDAVLMKEDRISNVRITLMKTLQLMPVDVRTLPLCAPVLKDLQDEMWTWESFESGEENTGQNTGGPSPMSIPSSAPQPQAKHRISLSADGSALPQVASTPDTSIDEDEVALKPSKKDKKEKSSKVSSPSTDSQEADDVLKAKKAEKKAKKEKKEKKLKKEGKKSGSDDDGETDDETGTGVNISADTGDTAGTDENEAAATPSKGSPASRKQAVASPSSPASDAYDPSGWRTVVFEDGPIGMQLEPTIDDKACRVYGFLHGDDGTPSPAKESGLILLGDVIVQVNGHFVESYDQTIAVLKAGGRRELTFRPGVEGDGLEEFLSDDGANSEGDPRNDKEAKKERKVKKEDKKEKKEKKAKKEDKKKKKESE